MNRKFQSLLNIATLCLAGDVIFAQETRSRSHPPMRPLPVAGENWTSE